MNLVHRIGSLGRAILVVMLAVAMLSIAVLTPTGTRAAGVRLVPVASGFNQPLFVTGPGTGSNRLFVVEKPGRIRVVKQGKLLATPFLDITHVVNDEANERGLLGLAFHPDYETNGQFYVDYNDANGDIVIARYTVSENNPDRASASGDVILTIPHREAENHNGGMLAFGPEVHPYLYISVGDGGSGQSANAQNTMTLLGKILRIDVDNPSGEHAYGIPSDNPFADGTGGLPEIWAYGLRNPFRFSFDRQTGAIFIGDVGQNAWEEIDFGRRGLGGLNYGWAIMEGRHCFAPPTGCVKTGLTLPIHEYSHDTGNVVTGGYRYRGQAIPALVGTYVFTNFGSQVLWGLQRNGDGTWDRSVLLRANKQLNIASFGESDAAELFAVDLVSGTLFRIAAA